MRGNGGSSASQLVRYHKIDDLRFLTGLLIILNPPQCVCYGILIIISDTSGVFIIK